MILLTLGVLLFTLIHLYPCFAAAHRERLRDRLRDLVPIRLRTFDEAVTEALEERQRELASRDDWRARLRAPRAPHGCAATQQHFPWMTRRPMPWRRPQAQGPYPKLPSASPIAPAAPSRSTLNTARPWRRWPALRMPAMRSTQCCLNARRRPGPCAGATCASSWCSEAAAHPRASGGQPGRQRPAPVNGWKMPRQSSEFRFCYVVVFAGCDTLVLTIYCQRRRELHSAAGRSTVQSVVVAQAQDQGVATAADKMDRTYPEYSNNNDKKSIPKALAT